MFYFMALHLIIKTLNVVSSKAQSWGLNCLIYISTISVRFQNYYSLLYLQMTLTFLVQEKI